MAQRAGFFNALLSNGAYDRRYNADDYRENLAVIISDGVLRSSADDLRPTANGLAVNIGVGRAWIRGGWYKNDSDYLLAVTTPPTANPRRDRIFLRFDNTLETRDIYLHYEEGLPAVNPVPPAPLDTDSIKDLVLCEVDVPVNATAVTVTDTRADAALCGWVYSVKGDESFFKTMDNNFNEWFNLKKDTLSSSAMFVQYTWQGVTTSADQMQIAFNIPQYDPEGVNIIQVYLNGFLLAEGIDYTLSESVISFTDPKEAGQEITVLCYRSIDATGIETIVGAVTELQNKVAALADFTEFNYICTGVDDNIKLSQIAQTFLNGSSEDNYRMKINIYGTLGVTTPYAGSGTATDPFQWFAFGQASRTSRRIIFDFSCARKVEITPYAGASHVIFYGEDINLREIYAYVTAGANTPVLGFSATYGRLVVENSAIVIYGQSGCKIGCTGVFDKCYLTVRNSAGDSDAFTLANNCYLVLTSCEIASHAASGKAGRCIHVPAAATTAVAVCNAVSCPTTAVTGHVQSYAVYDLSANGL